MPELALTKPRQTDVIVVAAETATTGASAAPADRPPPLDPLGLRTHRTLGWNNWQIFISACIFGISVPALFYATRHARLLPLLPLIALICLGSFIWMVIEYRRRQTPPRKPPTSRKSQRRRIRRLTLTFFIVAAVTFASFGAYMTLHLDVTVPIAATGFVGVVVLHGMLRLERRRLRIPWAQPVSMNLTVFGLFHTVLTIALGVLALQTGLNLVVAIFGVMLTLIVVSGVITQHNFRGLEATRELPEEIRAGEPVRLRVKLTNTKRMLPSYSIWLQEAWPDDMPLPDVIPSAYAVRVPPRGTVPLEYEVTFPTRGVYRFRGFTVVTRFPFSLFTRFRYITHDDEVCVLPTAGGLPGDLAARRDAWQARPSAAIPTRRGTGDFRSLREYIVGRDDVKHIHWPTTARSGAVFVREFEREATAPLWIVVERGAVGKRLEEAVGIAAACIEEAFRTAIGFTLVIPPNEPVGDIAYSLAHRRRCLEALARLQGYVPDNH
ncbi:MAG: DUF58 domain-containing protein, partial [Planctomycetota bacterium]